MFAKIDLFCLATQGIQIKVLTCLHFILQQSLLSKETRCFFKEVFCLQLRKI